MEIRQKERQKRPGIHSKNKAGRNKGSKNYKKRYRNKDLHKIV